MILALRLLVMESIYINVWEDKWVGNLKIKDYVNFIPNNLKNITINKIIDWDTKS